jgi:energy-coupling factor transport system permease protein
MRLKWLYLSIFIVYGWFTPGEAVLTLPMVNASYLPTVEGLQAGALRVAVLIAIVSVVAGLLQTIEKDKLVSAIIWLTLPLQRIGLDSQRLALLLVLTLDKVLQSEMTMRELLQESKQGAGLLNTASAVIASALLRVENSVGQEPTMEINLEDVSSPPLWQWLVPFLLGTGLYLLSY